MQLDMFSASIMQDLPKDVERLIYQYKTELDVYEAVLSRVPPLQKHPQSETALRAFENRNVKYDYTTPFTMHALESVPSLLFWYIKQTALEIKMLNDPTAINRLLRIWWVHLRTTCSAFNSFVNMLRLCLLPCDIIRPIGPFYENCVEHGEGLSIDSIDPSFRAVFERELQCISGLSLRWFIEGYNFD